MSNAPHIPVHLGAMQEAVQYQVDSFLSYVNIELESTRFELQLRARGDDILPGDVFLSNHPSAGGSHLPDLTVITPVFWGYCPIIEALFKDYLTFTFTYSIYVWLGTNRNRFSLWPVGDIMLILAVSRPDRCPRIHVL